MTETERITIYIILGILLFTTICFAGGYEVRKIKLDNFQSTVKNLSEEQKCLYICGFTFSGSFEGYKLCVEKCDRISERTVTAGVTQ